MILADYRGRLAIIGGCSAERVEILAAKYICRSPEINSSGSALVLSLQT